MSSIDKRDFMGWRNEKLAKFRRGGYEEQEGEGRRVDLNIIKQTTDKLRLWVKCTYLASASSHAHTHTRTLPPLPFANVSTRCFAERL